MRLGVLVFLSFVLLVLFLLGIFLLIPFPLAVFPAIIKSQVYIQHKKDGSYPKATSYWSNLPAIQWYDFYFFNISNPDEVLYNNAMPFLVEVGPYSYAETEFKENIDFFNGDKSVFYTNNKSWAYNQATSCDTCSYDDWVMVSNPAYMSGVYFQKTAGMPPAVASALDLLLMLLGEQPIITVQMKNLLFLGYPDPLINLLQSKFVAALLQVLQNIGITVPLPQMPDKMGYFPDYNHSADGNYTSLTGKGNVNNLGLIQTWCDQKYLPWWGDAYSQDVSGSGDGSFQKPQLKKTDKLKQFQSFTCRAFHLHYDSDTTVNGIKALLFKMDGDDYDTTIEKNRGYRYENIEMVDYFPNWPCGPPGNHTYNPNGHGCSSIDCSVSDNFCNSCCDGSHVMKSSTNNATVLLPPGIIPLRCLPGQYVPLPFAGFLSPPHFSWSPPEVISTMYGLHPDPNGIHHPGAFDIQPDTGSTVGGTFKMQLSVPIYNDQSYTQLMNTRNNFLPSFWVNVHVQMRDYARNYVHLTTRVLPQIILGVGIGTTAISCIGAFLLIFCIVRARRAKQSVLPKVDQDRTEKDEEAWS